MHFFQKMPLFRSRPDRVILILAVLGVALFQAVPGPRPLDDSYITFRYARNICQGSGFVYNPGDQVQGTTTPLYTLLLAGLCLPLGTGNIPIISFGIALAADVINVWLLFCIARQLLNERLAFILSLVFLFQPLRLNVAAGGMETSFFVLLLLLMYERYLVGRSFTAAAVFAALSILVRPDAVLAVAPLFLHALVQYRKKAIGPLLIAVAILLPWFFWAAWYFGTPIPQSVLAKMVAYAGYSAGTSLMLLLTFLGTGTVGPYMQLALIVPGLVAAFFLAVVGLRWAVFENRSGLVVVSYPLIYYAVMTLQHAPMFFTWYYVPLMPGLLVLFFAALQTLLKKVPVFQKNRLQPGLLILAGFLLVSLPAGLLWFFPGWSITRSAEKDYQQACDQVRGQVQPGAVIMAPDIGVIGWNLDQARILDPIGLVSPISLNYLKSHFTWETNMVNMTRDLKPDFIIANQTYIQPLLDTPQQRAYYSIIWQTPARSSSGSESTILVIKRTAAAQPNQ